MTSFRLRAGAAGLLLMACLAACSGGATPSGVATLQSPGPTDGAIPSASPSASLDPDLFRGKCDILVVGEIENIAADLFADLAAGS